MTYAGDGVHSTKDLERGVTATEGNDGTSGLEQPMSSGGQGVEMDDLGSVGTYRESDSSRRPLR